MTNREEGFLEQYLFGKDIDRQFDREQPIERLREASIAIDELIAYVGSSTSFDLDLSDDVRARFTPTDFPYVPGPRAEMQGLTVDLLQSDGETIVAGSLSTNVTIHPTRGYSGGIFFTKPDSPLEQIGVRAFRTPDFLDIKNPDFKAAMLATITAYDTLRGKQ